MQENCTIREYRDSDHPGLLRLVESFYGNGYPYPEFLDAEVLRQKQRSGDLIITVATDQAEEVIGIVAAERQHGSMEKTVVLKLRNVKEEYRKSGLATEQLNDLLERVAKRFRDAISIYADVMTHDPVSQRSLVRRGYTLTGLRLMQYTNAQMVPKLHFPPHTKMSQAIYCKNILGEKVHISAPERHQAWIENIYRALGVECIWEKPAGITEEKSVVIRHRSEKYSKCEWMIDRAGKDLHRLMAEEIAAEGKTGDFTWLLFLRMDAVCTEAYEALRTLGFYFAGIQPLTGTGEYLILAKTDGCTENFDQIALADVGVDWLSYIQEARDKENT